MRQTLKGKETVLAHLEQEAAEKGGKREEYQLIDEGDHRVLIVAGHVFFGYGFLRNDKKMLVINGNGLVTGEREIPKV